MDSATLDAVAQTLKANQMAVAQGMLADVLHGDPRDVQAWLWMSAVVKDAEQRKYCLTQALAVDPDSQPAKWGLALLQQERIPPNASLLAMQPRKHTQATRRPDGAQPRDVPTPPEAKTGRPRHLRPSGRSKIGNSLLYGMASLAAAMLLLAATLAFARDDGERIGQPPAATSTQAAVPTPIASRDSHPPIPTVAETPVADAVAAPARPDAICVDGGQSGRPFAEVNCLKTVTTISEAVTGIQAGALVVVRAFSSTDANSIIGMGTYREQGIRAKTLTASITNPIIIQAEGFDPQGGFTKPIVDGGIRITGVWEQTPGTNRTWQIPFGPPPSGFGNSACVDRIWVSRLPGKTQLADFPLTRPIPNQGNDNPETDCRDNTINGQPITPADVDSFPGSYEWLDGILYVHMPGDEDPNQNTVEIPYNLSFQAYEEGTGGLVIRGFRVYHTSNGIDFWDCGTSATDRCEASHNETSFNNPFGLQPGPYSYLHHNTGILNTLQLIKITRDYSEIAYNVAGPQLSQGFKLNDVRGCLVHDNEVYGSSFRVPKTDTQAGWNIIGTRDVTAGIYLRNGTQGCQITHNLVYGNTVGVYIRNDEGKVTQGNSIRNNTIVGNGVAVLWQDAATWRDNVSFENVFDQAARFVWGDQAGTLTEYVQATGQDTNSRTDDTR